MFLLLIVKVKNKERVVGKKQGENQTVAMNQMMTERKYADDVVMMKVQSQNLRIARRKNAIIKRSRYPLTTMIATATSNFCKLCMKFI